MAFSLAKQLCPRASVSLQPWFVGLNVETVRMFATLKPRIKDPERPKKPMSAWLLYLADFRKVQQSQGLKPTEVLQKASAEWKTLPAQEKQKFEAPAEEAKLAYQRAMKEYEDSGKKAAWMKDPECPTRPATGYIRFATEFRKKHPELKMTEASQKAGTEWNALTNQQKAPYNQAYEAEKAAYEKALAEYKASGKEAAYKEKTGIAAEEEKLAKKKAKEKEKLAKEKEKAKLAKEKLRAKLAKEKEKAKLARETEKEKAKAKLAKEKEKAKAGMK